MSLELLNAAWKADIGDPVAKLVMIYLADTSNAKDDGWCWPSIQKISMITQLSERTVQRKIRQLESGGFIKAIRGRNRCDYFVDCEKLNARLIDFTPSRCHPDRLSPCHTVTQELTDCHPATDTLSPQNGHSVSCHTREPESNPNLTRTEPESPAKKRKAKRPEIDMSKARGTLEELESFAVEIGLTKNDGAHMFYGWEENGWTKNSGKDNILDWRMTFRKWKSAGWFPSQKNTGGNFKVSHHQPTREPLRDVDGSPVIPKPPKTYDDVED